jgi:hypothetical protein
VSTSERDRATARATQDRWLVVSTSERDRATARATQDRWLVVSTSERDRAGDGAPLPHLPTQSR